MTDLEKVAFQKLKKRESDRKYREKNREILLIKKRIQSKVYREKQKSNPIHDKEFLKKKRHEYYLKSKEKSSYYSRNKEKIQERRLINLDKVKNIQKRYYEKNKEKIIKKQGDRLKELRRLGLNQKEKEWFRCRAKRKREIDINYKIKGLLSCRINNALKKQETVKSIFTEELLGCSIECFKEYFFSLFRDGMTWEFFMKGKIHIDHIKPCCSFNLSDIENQKICFHYTNLQPLWAIDNIKKGAKLHYIPSSDSVLV